MMRFGAAKFTQMWKRLKQNLVVWNFKKCTYILIMDSKLTLKLNSEVIARAKAYAQKQGSSVSLLVERYLESLTKRDDADGKIEITAFVRNNFSGGRPVDGQLDERALYHESRLEKHR
jgi:hypothetical protein